MKETPVLAAGLLLSSTAHAHHEITAMTENYSVLFGLLFGSVLLATTLKFARA